MIDTAIPNPTQTLTHAQYPAYKDSGVDWLGEIPAHWKVMKLKYEAEVVLGKMLCNTDQGNYSYKPYLKSKNIQWLRVDVSSVDDMWFSQKELQQYRLKWGDLILSEGGEVGKTCIWRNELNECYIQNSAHKVTVHQTNSPEFLLYLFFVYGKVGVFDSIVNRVSIAHLTRDKLTNVEIPLPPLSEQTRIAEFLDRKTAQIDQAIAQKERLIELLNERRQVMIHKAVTRGLNPDVPMKDSGIDWIGEIPAHWEVKKLKYVLTERNDRSDTGLETILMVSQEHGLVVRADYHDKAIAGQSSVGSKRVHYNDLVFNKLKAHLGVFFKSTIEEVGLVSPDYAVYSSIGVIEDLKFLELLFRHPAYIRQFICSATGIVEGLIRLYTGDLFNIRIPVPPLKEQKEILAKVISMALNVENALKKTQREINLLQELKSTLINSAVTGKIKV